MKNIITYADDKITDWAGFLARSNRRVFVLPLYMSLHYIIMGMFFIMLYIGVVAVSALYIFNLI